MSRFSHHFVRYLLCTFVLATLLSGLNAVCSAQATTGKTKQKPHDSESGILYGDNFAYMIAAPKGWVMDSEAGHGEGLSVVFYRKGETWQKGSATMYVNVIARKKGLKAKEVIADDIATFQKRHPDIKVTQDTTLQIGDKRSAITYIFRQINDKTSDERVAYVEMPTVILLITLTSTTTEDYTKAVADHTTLVSSVVYLALRVEVKRKS